MCPPDEVNKKELISMRIVRNGSGYELVQLDRKLKSRLLSNLRKRNLRLMETCIRDACKVNEDNDFGFEPDGVCALAAALFEKLATKSFTELAAKETRVVHELKETWNAKKRLEDQEYNRELCEEAANAQGAGPYE